MTCPCALQHSEIRKRKGSIREDWGVVASKVWNRQDIMCLCSQLKKVFSKIGNYHLLSKMRVGAFDKNNLRGVVCTRAKLDEFKWKWVGREWEEPHRKLEVFYKEKWGEGEKVGVLPGLQDGKGRDKNIKWETGNSNDGPWILNPVR